MTRQNAIDYLESCWGGKGYDLPEDIFFFISRLTPIVNVDLLIRGEFDNRILLSWRDDFHSNVGWHIPGGILRFKETFRERIEKVAQSEIHSDIKIGVNFTYNENPLDIHTCMHEMDTRGHHVPILYECFLSSDVPLNNGKKEGDVGYLKWFDDAPDNLIKAQHNYRRFI